MNSTQDLDANGLKAAVKAFNLFGHNMSDIPPIEAALRAYLETGSPSEESIAASTAVAPVAVGVKALVWASEPPYSVARAANLPLIYSTEAVWDARKFLYVDLKGNCISGTYPTVEAAKAAAQADFNARILSSIIPAAKPAGVAALRSYAESFHFTVTDSFYSDAYIGIHEPDSITFRLGNGSQFSKHIAKLEERRKAALSAGIATPQVEGPVSSWRLSHRADPASKARLLGVHPDDQDVELEDSDWTEIVAALEGDKP